MTLELMVYLHYIMNPMRYLSAILLGLLLFAGKLPAQDELRRAEEDRTIRFDEKVHDFGDVPLSAGVLTHTFRFKNVSDKPIVIHNVISSCGCTVPQWTRQPVMPAGVGEVNVTFNNDQGAYPFDKSLTVYVSGISRPVILRIRGNVVDGKKPMSSTYPEKFGQIGLRQKDFSIGYIDQGIAKTDYTYVANLSNKTVNVTLADLTPGLKASIYPNSLPAGRTAKLTYTVDPNATKGKIWGRHDFSLSFQVDGAPVPGRMTVTGIITDNFSGMTQREIAAAADPVVEKSYFEFGEIRSGKVVDASYKFVNKGKSDLVIHTVDKKDKGVSIVTRTPLTVKPGKSAEIKIRFDSSQSDGEMLEVLSVITNSPAKPIVNLFLTGNVIRQ